MTCSHIAAGSWNLSSPVTEVSKIDFDTIPCSISSKSSSRFITLLILNWILSWRTRRSSIRFCFSPKFSKGSNWPRSLMSCSSCSNRPLMVSFWADWIFSNNNYLNRHTENLRPTIEFVFDVRQQNFVERDDLLSLFGILPSCKNLLHLVVWHLFSVFLLHVPVKSATMSLSSVLFHVNTLTLRRRPTTSVPPPPERQQRTRTPPARRATSSSPDTSSLSSRSSTTLQHRRRCLPTKPVARWLPPPAPVETPPTH
jgi:hypothetical protein